MRDVGCLKSSTNQQVSPSPSLMNEELMMGA
jgi:hypothetical protein